MGIHNGVSITEDSSTSKNHSYLLTNFHKDAVEGVAVRRSNNLLVQGHEVARSSS